MKTLDADKFLSQFKDEGGTVTMSKMHEAIKAATVEVSVFDPAKITGIDEQIALIIKGCD